MVFRFWLESIIFCLWLIMINEDVGIASYSVDVETMILNTLNELDPSEQWDPAMIEWDHKRISHSGIFYPSLSDYGNQIRCA